MMTRLAILAHVQAFRLRGDVHEKEVTCGFLNVVIMLLSKADKVSDALSNVSESPGSLTPR